MHTLSPSFGMFNPVKAIARDYWVEIVTVPPFVAALCYFLYGDVYFSSLENFLRISLPWSVPSVVSPICCHWVRRIMLRRFPKFEDWPKRVLWSLAGYLFFTIGFAKITYWSLAFYGWENLIPTQQKFYGLLLFAAMSVLLIAMIYEGVTYFEKWKTEVAEVEQLEKLSLETRLQSLQSQLNPHFLFNSLNVLSSLIGENPRRAENFVDELSNVYRYLLRTNEKEWVTVQEELRFIHSFFHLLETRHEGGVFLKVDVSEAALKSRLPSLALQILVENAVKHNEIAPDYPLLIEIYNRDNTLVVRNNVRPKKNKAASNRVGLNNLRRRYELLDLEGFEAEEKNGYFGVILPIAAT